MNNIEINDIYEKIITYGHEIAMHECKGGYPDKEDCTWYHGNWMLLRYLGVVSNPYWHEKFYRKALASVNANALNVLVAGTADFSLPLLCSDFGICKLDICDICRTPLLICDKTSELLNYDWSTYIQNVCNEFHTHYDVIINDAFLSRFIDKNKVLKGIANGLKSNGFYITTLKIGKWNRGGEVTTSVREAFLNKVEKRYEDNKRHLPNIDINEISRVYLDKMSSFPVRDKQEIIELFSNAGLKIIHIENEFVEGEFEESQYYRIVSQKNDIPA